LGQSSPEHLNISIGQIPLSLQIEGCELLKQAQQRYEKFLSPSAQAMPILVRPSAERDDFNGRGSCRRPDFSYEWSGAVLQLEDAAAQFRGVRHEFGLDSLIRILLSVLLVPRGGFLLHAATVLHGGKTYVFTGRSGAGKSTIASLSPAGTVLTDEISLLRRVGDEWNAYGTPFWGEFRAEGNNTHASLAGVYVIHQAPEDHIEPMSPHEAVRAMLPNVMFFSREPEITSHLLQLLAEIASQVPCYRLYFRRQSSFWKVVVP
jgi:hypothetical protein